MKLTLLLCLTCYTTAFGTLTPKEIRYLLEADYDTDESRVKFKSEVDLLSKNDVFQLAEFVSSQDIPVTLSRIIYIATIKFKYFSEVYTDDEKARLARLIIQSVEKHIEKTGRYETLSDLYCVDHPLVDELIERLLPIKDEDCVRNLNILVLGIAETRSKKAAAPRHFSVEETSAVLPEPIKAPGATAKESELKPASKALANSVWSKWRWALIGTIAAAVILWLTLKRRP